jgi:hypothetical protein
MYTLLHKIYIKHYTKTKLYKTLHKSYIQITYKLQNCFIKKQKIYKSLHSKNHLKSNKLNICLLLWDECFIHFTILKDIFRTQVVSFLHILIVGDDLKTY